MRRRTTTTMLTDEELADLTREYVARKRAARKRAALARIAVALPLMPERLRPDFDLDALAHRSPRVCESFADLAESRTRWSDEPPTKEQVDRDHMDMEGPR